MEEQLQTPKNAHENSKAITIQAFGYLSALLCTLSMPLLRIVIGDESIYWTHRGQIVLVPLEGMFNFVIFTCHKIYNYRRVHPDARRLDVLKKLLYAGPDKIDDEVLFSRISMISIANVDDDDNNRIERIHVTNERNEEEVLHFNDDEDHQNDGEEEQHYDKIEDGISNGLSGAVSSISPSPKEGSSSIPGKVENQKEEETCKSNSIRLTSSLVAQLANNNVQSISPRNDALSNVGSSLGSVGLSYAPSSSRNEQSLSRHMNNDSLDAVGVRSGTPSMDVEEGTFSDESLNEKRKNVSLLERLHGFSWLHGGRRL